MMVLNHDTRDLDPVSGREFIGKRRNDNPVNVQSRRTKLMKPLALLTSAIVMAATAVHAEPQAGYDRFDITVPQRSAPVSASVWYPAGRETYRGLVGDNAVFHGTSAYIGAAMAAGKHPLVVMSHGSGGNMDNIGWLSSKLALKGAIVVAVNHPGSTSGDSSPRRSLRLRERAGDLKALLDHVLTDPELASRIDPARITSLGFSLGGATALNLAGAVTDGALYKPYCDRFPDAADCVFFTKGGIDFARMPAAFSGDMRDPRIRAAVAIDPGFTYAMTKQSLKAINMPVMLINLGGDDLWKAIDVSANGSAITDALPQVEYARLAPAHHFTFLALCKPQGAALLAEERDDPVCDDPAGTDRARIHEEITARIALFLGL